MSYTIRYEPEALESLANVPLKIQTRIVKKLDWLVENFDNINPLGLTGDLAEFYKLRVGDYRVIYELSDIGDEIIIVKLGHRRDVYDR